MLSSGDSRCRFIGPVDRIIKAPVLSPFVSQSLRPLTFKRNSEDLQFLSELTEAGKLTPVIDKTYSLSETADAIRYLETGSRKTRHSHLTT